MVFLTNLLNYKRHITESDNGYVPYCFFCNAVFSQSTSKICTLIRFTLFSNYPEQGSKKSFVLLPYRFTLFSNREVQTSHYSYVLLPYRFTLFSNSSKSIAKGIGVLLPYRFTLFSNCKFIVHRSNWFYYLIDLHYSQTRTPQVTRTISFTTL